MTSLLDNVKILSSGAVAGAISRTSTAPLERLKIFQQVQSMKASGAKYQGIFPSLLRMLREEGLRGYFKGNGTNCVKVVPASAIRFLAFENFKTLLLLDGSSTLTTSRKLMAGSGAGVTAVVATYPLDLIRTRLALQVETKHYQGIMDAFTKIIRANGIRGLYQGAGTAVTSVAPFAAVNFTCYEILKERVAKYIKNPPIWLSAAYGATAGSIAMTILYPLDLLKRRLMVQGHDGVEKKYRNGLHAFVTIIRSEGPISLYRGIIASYMKVIPTVSITWLSYEVMKTFLNLDRKKKR